jgi:hypothetical protein
VQGLVNYIYSHNKLHQTLMLNIKAIVLLAQHLVALVLQWVVAVVLVAAGLVACLVAVQKD